MQAIREALAWVLTWLHTVIPDYGIDIIVYTVLLKLILLPLNISQTKSTIKTQMIQPKLKALQEKYKNDQQKLGQAQMDLYKSEGVNPMAGCLPLLIQMPILFALYWVFRDFPYGGEGFLWIKDLAGKDPYYILPVISGVTTYLSTLLATPKNQGDANQGAASSSTMNLVMSAFFLYVSIGLASGLVLYWVVNNILQMLLQVYLNKIIHRELEAKAETAGVPSYKKDKKKY